MSDLIEREYLLNIARQDGAYGYVSEHEILNAPNAETTGALDDAIQEYIKDGYILAEPTEYVKDGTLTVQMPTIKDAKSIEKVVVYADTYKQEYFMPTAEPLVTVKAKQNEGLYLDTDEETLLETEYIVVATDGMYKEYIHETDGKPRVGKWIENETSYADNVRQTCDCSVCGKRSPRPLGDYCRWCGAEMKGASDGYSQIYMRLLPERSGVTKRVRKFEV